LYKLDTIQREFKDDFIVIPITNEKAQKADEYFKSRGWSLPTIVNDTNLQRHFPHRYIPHYIWVNKTGEISAITGYEAVNRKNIQELRKGNTIKMPIKNDLLTFKSNQPLFIDGNGGDGSSIKYRSLLSGPITGLGQTASSVITDTVQATSRVYCINCQILMLYTIAYNKLETFPQNRIIVDINGFSKFQAMEDGSNRVDWLKNNKYCYELIVPSNSPGKIREQVAEDLNRFFNLRARFEKRKVDCYILSALPEFEKSFTKGNKR